LVSIRIKSIRLSELLSKISIWVIVLPLVIGCIFYTRLSYISRLMLFVVGSGNIPQLFRAVWPEPHILSFTYNGYTLIEFALVFLVFKRQIKRNRRVLETLAILYYIIACLFLAFEGIENRFLSELVCVNNVIYTSWILLFIIEQYQENDLITFDFNVPFFWYLLGLFFYCPCTALVFSLWQYIKAHPESNVSNLWVIHSCFNILLYLFISVGFLKEGNFSRKAIMNKL
jgi:hypothetical protein